MDLFNLPSITVMHREKGDKISPVSMTSRDVIRSFVRRSLALFRVPAHLNDQRISIVGDFFGTCIGTIHARLLLLGDQEERKRSRRGHACIGSLPFSNMQISLRVIPMQCYG